jgi:hypothetical protein
MHDYPGDLVERDATDFFGALADFQKAPVT